MSAGAAEEIGRLQLAALPLLTATVSCAAAGFAPSAGARVAPRASPTLTPRRPAARRLAARLPARKRPQSGCRCHPRRSWSLPTRRRHPTWRQRRRFPSPLQPPSVATTRPQAARRPARVRLPESHPLSLPQPCRLAPRLRFSVRCLKPASMSAGGVSTARPDATGRLPLSASRVQKPVASLASVGVVPTAAVAVAAAAALNPADSVAGCASTDAAEATGWLQSDAFPVLTPLLQRRQLTWCRLRRRRSPLRLSTTPPTRLPAAGRRRLPPSSQR